MEKFEIIKNVKCEELSYEGYGTFRKNDFLYLIDNFLPNEIADIKIIKTTTKVIYGKVHNIIHKSPLRIKPKNSDLLISGSAPLSNLAYEEQLKWKNEIIQKFTKWNLPNTKIFQILPSPKIWNYRNKITVFFEYKNEKIYIGLYEKNSHNLVTQNSYDLVDEKISNLIIDIQNNINNFDLNSLKKITKLSIRISNFNDSLQLSFYSENKIEIDNNFINYLKNKFNNIVEISLFIVKKEKIFNTINLYKKENLIQKINEIKYIVSPESFFQVNFLQTNILYKKIYEELKLKKKDKVIDLFCGVGSIGLFLTKYVEKVRGIEIIEKAIENAKKNMELNKIKNIEFYCLNADKLSNNIFDKYNVLVLDPPRSGVSKETLEMINKSNIEKIAYVSCNYHTLIRDLKILEKTFKIINLTPFDMFPQTSHIEVLVILEKKI